MSNKRSFKVKLLMDLFAHAKNTIVEVRWHEQQGCYYILNNLCSSDGTVFHTEDIGIRYELLPKRNLPDWF